VLAKADPRAVRVHADGSLSLRPGVDFREPGRECPQPPVVPTVPLPAYTPGIEVREQRIPDFLLRRAPPLVWLVPGGNA
jgi:hypothetical protein